MHTATGQGGFGKVLLVSKHDRPGQLAMKVPRSQARAARIVTHSGRHGLRA